MKVLNDQKLQKKIGFFPHSGQQKILDAFQKKRQLTICAGRRFGKSIICGYLCLRKLFVSNQKVWIAAPTYELARKPFDYVVQWIGTHYPHLARKGITNRPVPKIQIGNSFLECRSAENPIGFLGAEVDLLIIEEASHILREVYEKYLFPVISSRKAKMVLVSSPWGRDWFYDEFIRSREDPNVESFCFKSIDNPYFSKAEWELAKERLPEDVFRQNYLAEFLENAAQVFRKVKEIIKEDCLKDVEQGRYYVMGVDLGKYKDFTVLTVIDRSTHNVVFFDRFKKIDWTLQKARITATAKRYNNAKIILDSTGLGDPICDDLRLAGLIVEDFVFSGFSKQQLIEKLSISIEQQNISIPPIKVLLDELDSFGYTISEKSRRMIYSAPEGMHDDCVISLALANWAIPGKRIFTDPIKEEMKKFRILLNREKRKKLFV